MVISEGHSRFNDQGLQFSNSVLEAVIYRYRHILVTGEMILRYLPRSNILSALFAPYIFGILQVL